MSTFLDIRKTKNIIFRIKYSFEYTYVKDRNEEQKLRYYKYVSNESDLFMLLFNEHYEVSLPRGKGKH